MSAFDTSFLDRAMIYAIKAHAGVERRGKGFPYAVHVMEAMTIVASMTNDPEMLAAAVLHDVVEDTPTTLDDLRRDFGERVAELVKNESEEKIEEKPEEDTWIFRKQAAIHRIMDAPRDSKIVALGDKLSNMRAIAADYEELGDNFFSRFHTSDPALHAWHYRGLLKALKELEGTDAYTEFEWLVNKTFPLEKYNDYKDIL